MTAIIPSYVGWRAMQQPIFFQSQMALLLDARPPRVVDKMTEVVAEEAMADSERFAAGQMRLLGSEYLSDIVEKNLSLAKGTLAGRLIASIDQRSHVITLEVDDLEPAKAELYVKAFGDAYIANTIDQRTGVAHDATRFLDGEAGTLRTKVELDEKSLYDFNKSNTLLAANFDDSHRIASQNLEKYHAQAAGARSANIKLRAQLESIAAAKEMHDPALMRALILPAAGETWTGPQSRWIALQEQLRQLETKYGPQHPKVIEIREAVAAVGDILDKQVATAMLTVDLRFRENDSELAQLRVLIGEETGKAMALRQKELDYLRLKRTVDEDRDAYTMVAKRGRETALMSLLRESYVKRLDGPSPPSTVSRRVTAQTAIALLAGFVLGLALALLIDLLDDSLKTPAEAERELKQPLLGLMMQIPLPPARDGQPIRDPEIARAEHIVKNPRSLVAEQCHSFTTQIFSMFMDKPPRALMVVSAAVEDGKTLVALHLASTVAARGKRVLIVDADLRRGRLHRMFQLGRGGGLYELVTQKVTIEEATRRTWIPNVDVLTTGDVPLKLSPLRVFEHPQLANVIEALKARYDLVVFDTPPVPLVSDALLLANMVDGAVAVARAKKTSRALTRRLAEQLLGARVNLIGWLLNDLTAAELKSKYYYRYGYGRGYAYKYSDEEAA
ncbi:MAG: Capsular exopolysaccharide family protein [Myxococcales bacterium]|nr:Capsular exopolysaccharide family protein [Myxococcales bacterium]